MSKSMGSTIRHKGNQLKTQGLLFKLPIHNARLILNFYSALILEFPEDNITSVKRIIHTVRSKKVKLYLCHPPPSKGLGLISTTHCHLKPLISAIYRVQESRCSPICHLHHLAKMRKILNKCFQMFLELELYKNQNIVRCKTSKFRQ